MKVYKEDEKRMKIKKIITPKKYNIMNMTLKYIKNSYQNKKMFQINL